MRKERYERMDGTAEWHRWTSSTGGRILDLWAFGKPGRFAQRTTHVCRLDASHHGAADRHSPEWWSQIKSTNRTSGLQRKCIIEPLLSAMYTHMSTRTADNLHVPQAALFAYSNRHNYLYIWHHPTLTKPLDFMVEQYDDRTAIHSDALQGIGKG